MSIQSSPQRSPSYSLHRIISASDTVANLKKMDGMVCSPYNTVNIQVVPIDQKPVGDDWSEVAAGTSNPNIAVYFWNDALGVWVQGNTAIAYTGVGAGTPYEVSINANGRRILVALTNAPATNESVAIFVSGFTDHELV